MNRCHICKHCKCEVVFISVAEGNYCFDYWRHVNLPLFPKSHSILPVDVFGVLTLSREKAFK